MFDRRRTPLTVWFEVCWMFASEQDGLSALSLQRALEIGSYPTAWAMLHRPRSVAGAPGPRPVDRHRRQATSVSTVENVLMRYSGQMNTLSAQINRPRGVPGGHTRARSVGRNVRLE
jgi:hypothetical protein